MLDYTVLWHTHVFPIILIFSELNAMLHSKMHDTSSRAAMSAKYLLSWIKWHFKIFSIWNIVIMQAREGKQQTSDLFELISFFPNIFLFTMFQNYVSLYLPREAQKELWSNLSPTPTITRLQVAFW